MRCMEQLAELLGQPMPAYLTEATREPHLLRLLAEAAENVRRRLVLVVDGLDEDRGVTDRPGCLQHRRAAAGPAAGRAAGHRGRTARPAGPG